MRVLLLSSVYPNALQPSYGVFIRERARHLARHCQIRVVAPVPWFPFNRLIRGRQRALVPPRETGGEFEVYHPPVFSIPAVGKCFDGFFYFASLLSFLRGLRREFAFDVIDAHFGYPDGVGASLLGRALGCPVVITLRGNEVMLERSTLRRPQLRWALGADRAIAVSEALRDLAIRIGAPSTNVRVIRNGVDSGVFRPTDRAASRARLDLPADRPVLVSVGSFVPGKGHERVIDLLPELRRAVPGLLYVAVGIPGGGESRLNAIRSRAEVRRDEVRLAVSRPHDEIADWLNAADVFCLASEREGCSNAILEALACGLPVVTTRVGGNPELIRDGENGFLVPYFDGSAFVAAIRSAFEHSWDRAAIARQVTRRSWKEVGDDVFEELELAVGASTGGADSV